MIREFFYAVSYSAAMNLHLKILDGGNNHHMAEAMFKAFGKALDMATMEEPQNERGLVYERTVCRQDRKGKHMSYKRLTPCVFIYKGKAVRWFDDKEVLSEDVVGLAKYYSDRGADELIVFDLSRFR